MDGARKKFMLLQPTTLENREQSTVPGHKEGVVVVPSTTVRVNETQEAESLNCSLMQTDRAPFHRLPISLRGTEAGRSLQRFEWLTIL